MKKNKFLVFLILFLVYLVSGCSSQNLPNISNTDDLTNVTTTGNLTNVTTNSNYTITIILVDETNLDVLETYERTVVIGDDLSSIYDEINLYEDYIIKGLYLDSQLTTELTSFQVNSDMDIYVSVNELQLLNITVIYDSDKIPNYSYYTISGGKLNTFLVNNHIGYFLANPIIEFNLYYDELHTQPYNEDAALTSDLTIYASVLFEEPYYLTIISSDGVFEDIIIQNFEEKFYTKQDLYDAYIDNIVHSSTWSDYQLYYDQALTNPYIEATIDSDTTLYAKFTFSNYLNINIKYSGYINEEINLIYPTNTYIYDYIIIDYISVILGHGYFESEVYQDSTMTQAFTQGQPVYNETYYVDVQALNSYTAFFFFPDIDNIDFLFQSNMHSITLEDSLFEDILTAKGYVADSYTLEFYSDETFTTPYNKSKVNEDVTIYVKVNTSPTPSYFVTFNYDFAGTQKTQTISILEGEYISNTIIANYLTNYFGDNISVDFDLYLDSAFTTLWDNAQILNNTNIYVKYTTELEDAYDINFIFIDNILSSFTISYDEEMAIYEIANYLILNNLQYNLDLNLLDSFGLYYDPNRVNSIDSSTIYKEDSTIYIDLQVQEYIRLTLDISGDYQGQHQYLKSASEYFNANDVLTNFFDHKGLINPSWIFYQDQTLTNEINLVDIYDNDTTIYIVVEEHIPSLLSLIFPEYSDYLTEIEFYNVYDLNKKDIEEILLTDLSLSKGTYNLQLFTDASLQVPASNTINDSKTLYAKVSNKATIDVEFNFLVNIHHYKAMTLYLGDNLAETISKEVLVKYLQDSYSSYRNISGDMILNFYVDIECQTPLTYDLLVDDMTIFVSVEFDRISTIIVNLEIPQQNSGFIYYEFNQSMSATQLLDELYNDLRLKVVDESILSQIEFYNDYQMTSPFKEYMFYSFVVLDIYVDLNIDNYTLGYFTLNYLGDYQDTVEYIFDTNDPTSLDKALLKYESTHPYLTDVYTYNIYLDQYMRFTPYTNQTLTNGMDLYISTDYIGESTYDVELNFMLDQTITQTETITAGETLNLNSIIQIANTLLPNAFWLEVELFQDNAMLLPYENKEIYQDTQIYININYYDDITLVDKVYYATGSFAYWDYVLADDSEFVMDYISINDQRINSIKTQLTDASVILLKEITINSANSNFTETFIINGEEITFPGSLAIKIIRADENVYDLNLIDFYAISYESGPVHNLTPDTLFIPRYTYDNSYKDGTWNSNPYAYEFGTYYLICAEINGEIYMGLIRK